MPTIFPKLAINQLSLSNVGEQQVGHVLLHQGDRLHRLHRLVGLHCLQGRHCLNLLHFLLPSVSA